LTLPEIGWSIHIQNSQYIDKASPLSSSEQVKLSINNVYDMRGNALQCNSVLTVVILLVIFGLGITFVSEFLSEAAAENDAFSVQETNSTNDKKDVFGVSEIYPTAIGGREWFVNMTNPANSSHFSETGGFELIKQNDGSWRVNSTHVRLVVETPKNMTEWKNVEITGYAKLSLPTDINSTSSVDSNSNHFATNNSESEEIDDLAFIGRSGRHSSQAPCEGTAYVGGLHNEGSVGWKKEIWHTGGYTDERAKNTVTKPILDRWVGWKVIIYDLQMNNQTAVKLESFLDDHNNDSWKKVTEIIDSGGWYSRSSDEEFFSADCGRMRDQIIIEPGPFVIFRTDNLILDFKNLSVREIDPSLA
jgi:hypothetical protein